jgi:hypothetical protein
MEQALRMVWGLLVVLPQLVVQEPGLLLEMGLGLGLGQELPRLLALLHGRQLVQVVV